MILPSAAAQEPKPETITLADGQTFKVLVTRPNYAQRFEDEGRQLRAYAGQPDAWAEYKLGRIRSCVVDWTDMTNEKEQPIPYTYQRLLGLMDVAPEVASQLDGIAAECFRPLAQPKQNSAAPPETSGKAEMSIPIPTPGESSASTATSDASAISPGHSESAPAS